MEWIKAKAKLIEEGGVRLSGDPPETTGSYSKAGPGAGLPPPLFFSPDEKKERRVRLPIKDDSKYILHIESGKVRIEIDGAQICGKLEPAPLHCPGQAFIAVTESCIYNCCFCGIARKTGLRKSSRMIQSLVEENLDTINAISLTSGVLSNTIEEEEYVISIVDMVKKFDLPVGVSILPNDRTSERLLEHGVDEVKFNLETATGKLFEEVCPGLEREIIFSELERSVELFGKNKVYSNVIIGLGERDEDLKNITEKLAFSGVIPVLRPLTPAGKLTCYKSPSAERLIGLAEMQKDILEKAGLDGSQARTMCAACTACDIAPWRDI